MITALIALIGPYVLPLLGGVVSGVGINLVGLLTSTGGRAAVQVIPLAIRLALRIVGDNDDDEQQAKRDAKRDAVALLAAADPAVVANVKQQQAAQ